MYSGGVAAGGWGLGGAWWWAGGVGAGRVGVRAGWAGGAWGEATLAGPNP